MNRIQQEALAKSTGLSRDELAASLVEREALQKIGVADLASAKEKYNTLVATHGVQYAMANLGDESYARQLESTSNTEKLQSIVEKIKDAFIPLAEDLLPKINKALTFLSKHSSGILHVMEAIAVVIGVNMVAGLVSAISKASILVAEFVTMAAAWAIANPISALAGLAIAGGITAAYSMKDGMIDPKGGLVVSGEKGTYKLDPQDHVIAGTDLGKGKNQSQQSINANMDITPLLEEMRNVKNILSQILSKEGNVYMDSTKVGTAINIGTYKTQ